MGNSMEWMEMESEPETQCQKKENTKNDSSVMDWEDGPQRSYVGFMRSAVVHSTPLMYRPAPIASPNMSRIKTSLEEEIEATTHKISKLKLN